MKKWILIPLMVVLLCLISVFVLISNQLMISKITLINSTAAAANRYLSNEKAWKKWWPAKENPGDDGMPDLTYGGCDFHIVGNIFNSGQVHIIDGKENLSSTIVIIQLPPDSVAIEWQASITTSLNPFKRILQYGHARYIKANMTVIMDHLRSFLENKEKLYGYNIEHTTLKDTVVMTTKIN